MKKNIILFVVLLLIFMVGSDLLYSQGKKPRFYLKASGFKLFTDGREFQNIVDNNTLYYPGQNTSPYYNNSVSSTNDFVGFSGEIGFETRKHAVGISIGYTKRDFNVIVDYYRESTGLREDTTWDYHMNAIPIFLNLHYKIIQKPFFKVFLTVAPGVYVANFKQIRDSKYENHPQYTFVSEDMKTNLTHLGLNIGTTIDIMIFKHLALSIDAGYRLVSFENPDTKRTRYNSKLAEPVTISGDLYIWERVGTDLVRMYLGESPDTNTNWTSRPAKFDMNGLVLKVGFKIIL